MNNPVAFCSFATLCSSILQDTSVRLYELGKEADELMFAINATIGSVVYYGRNTNSLARYRINSESSDALIKTALEHLDNISSETKSATLRNKNGKACYETAKQKITKIVEETFPKMGPCEETTTKKVNVVLDNLTELLEALKGIAQNVNNVIPACAPQSKQEDELHACIAEKLSVEKDAFTKLRNKVIPSQIQGNVDLQNALEESKVCFERTKINLNADLKEVRSATTECIAAL